MIRPKIKLIKEYPDSEKKGTVFTPDDYDYSPERGSSVSFEDVEKFKKYFKVLPFDYTILKKEGDKILSVKRHYDKRVFKIGDKFKNSMSNKSYVLTGFELENSTVILMYRAGKNCGINNATKIYK